MNTGCRSLTTVSFPTRCIERRRDDRDDEHKIIKYSGYNGPLVHPPKSIQHNNFTYNGNNYSSNSSLIIRREYHATTPAERAPAAIALSLGALAATAKAAQYAVQGYNEWMEQRRQMEEELKKNPPVDENVNNAQGGDASEEKGSGQSSGEAEGAAGAGGKQGDASSEQKRENIFANFFNISVGSKYYEGGFEDKMTRKEAALILGVREYSAVKRIKEAHRKLLILNHPDTGGSTYIAGKINEAKELLLQGKKS